MKKIVLILFPVLFTLNSCQFFDKGVPSKEELLQKELKSINWNVVDEFPSVSECEKIEDKKLRQQCFFEILTQTIQEKLSNDTLMKLYPKLDTLNVKVTVLSNSTLKFESQFPKDSLEYDRVKMDSILYACLVDFPKINPAIKRGLPVKTEFVLPVVIQKK